MPSSARGSTATRPERTARRAGAQAVPEAVVDSTLSVLVVDDHRAFGEALAMAISIDNGVAVRTVRSAGEALRLVEAEDVTVVFLDLGPPGAEGIDAIRRLREAAEVRVIAVSQMDDELVWARAVEAGAVGYVTRRTPARQLPEMARAAARGESLVDPDEQARLLRVLRRQRHQESTERQRANRLTPRQVEILQLTADGVSSREIAVRLGMSQLTLRTHMQNILTRLGVHSKYEALTVAIRHGKVRAGL
jgi:DNA-binding NarL/FixJ family response regulator